MADQTPWGFFSYSRHDSEFVLRLAKDLRAAGASVWLDQLDIVPGQHWDSAIEKALGNCPRMLVVLSPDSVESTNVMDEVSYALEENKAVIPILYRDCKTPFRLRRLQYVDARIDYQKGLAQLLGMLGIADAGGQGVPLHPPGTLEEHAHAAEAAAQSAAAETARLAQEKREAERSANEKAEAARLAAEKSAAEDRQRAEAARRAQERADQEQAARTEQERQTRLIAERTQQAAARVNKPEVPVAATAKSSKIKYVGVAAVVVVILLVLVLANRPTGSTTENSPHADVSPSTTLYPEAGAASSARPEEPPPERAPEKQAEPDVKQWLKEFLAAGEGPTVDGLQQYYDDVVSPYFNQQSATWESIAKDKEAYFRRFPTIHYTLLAEPEVLDVPGGKMLTFDLQYSNIRKDGQTLEGRTHETLVLHMVDGRWKVSGISEQVGAR